MGKRQLAVWILLVVSNVASAGFVVESRRGETDYGDPSRVNWEPGVVTAYLDPEAGKLAQEGMILHADSGEIIMVMDEQQAFYRNTVEGFCDEMDAVLKGMFESPEMQQILASMGQGPGGTTEAPAAPRIEVRKVSSGEVAGYRADHYQVLADGQVVEEQWVATDPRLASLDPAEASGSRELVSKFDACQARFDETTGGATGAPEEGPDVRGYVLRTVAQGWVEEVRSVREKPLPPTVFEPPAGYRRVALTELYGGGVDGADDDQLSFEESGYREAAQAAMDAEASAASRQPTPEPPAENADSSTSEDLSRELSEGAGRFLKGLFGK